MLEFIVPKNIIWLFLFVVVMVFIGCAAVTENPTTSTSSSTSSTTATVTVTTATVSSTSTTTTTATTSTTSGTEAETYDLGSYTVQDLWVDALSGSASDSNSGTLESLPVRTFQGAWGKLPQSTTLESTGYRINIKPGTYDLSSFWPQNVWGTASCPIIIQATNADAVTINGLNIKNCRYVYVINTKFHGNCSSGDGFHFESCDHVLIRNCEIDQQGDPVSGPIISEALKANQCQYFYVEDSNIHHANNVALDFVAVQYGHITRNTIHHSHDWCAYLKGGSGYFIVANNEFYNSYNNGGFSAGEGNGLSYMTEPWTQYGAYGIKAYNNVIHDTAGAGLGVWGGYDIILAHNTLYRVGSRSHAIEVEYGGREVGESPARSTALLANGAWGYGPIGGDCYYIPNKNVLIFNNLIYNPSSGADEYHTLWKQFNTHDQLDSARVGFQVPVPVICDDGLVVKGNLIYNHPTNGEALGIGDSGQHEARISAATVEAQNWINRIEPQLNNPTSDDFSLPAGSNVLTAESFTIPAFTWTDAPSLNDHQTPPAPDASFLDNTQIRNKNGRTNPGAY
jgi:hypothetical protein